MSAPEKCIDCTLGVYGGDCNACETVESEGPTFKTQRPGPRCPFVQIDLMMEDSTKLAAANANLAKHLRVAGTSLHFHLKHHGTFAQCPSPNCAEWREAYEGGGHE